MGSPWPQAAQAAVSLTYDDGTLTQINNAVPALDQHGLKGTFFLQGTAASLPESTENWKAASRRGHELAGHSIYHPCNNKKVWVKKGFALEDYTLERMSKELDDSIVFLKGLTENSGPFTHAYPCGETYVGEDHQSYIPLVAQKFLAARTMVESVAVPGAFSFPEVPTIAAENLSGRELVSRVKQAEGKGGWAVFMFHGVGGEYMSVTLEAHEELLTYLVKNRPAIWTDTFGTIAKHLKTS